MKNLLAILAVVLAFTLSVPAQSVDKKVVKKDVKTTNVVEKKTTTKKDMKMKKGDKCEEECGTSCSSDKDKK